CLLQAGDPHLPGQLERLRSLRAPEHEAAGLPLGAEPAPAAHVLQPHPPVRTAERAERLLDDPSSDPWGPGAEMTVRVRREPEARRRLPQAEHPVAVIPHLEAGTSGVGAL